MPPQRVFNIPNISQDLFKRLFNFQARRNDTLSKLKQKNTMGFYRISSVYPISYTKFSVPLDKMAQVPPYEIIQP